MEPSSNHSHCCQSHYFRFLAGVFSIFLLILAVFYIINTINKVKEGRYIGQEIKSQNTINVTGEGEIYAKPDLAIASFGVTTEAKTVAAALSQNTEKMNAVIKAIKDLGVEDKDIKTTYFNIYPRYEYYNSTAYPEGKRVLVGYDINQSLEVKIRQIDKVGQFIEAGASAGANQVGDLQFTIDKQDELKKQAREQAIKKAKDQAQELAGQLGIKLVRIVSFSENGIMPMYDYAAKGMGIGGGEGATPQIQTGENKISVTVNIIYEIE